MARIVIDNSGEIWGSACSIADLAQYTPCVRDKASEDLNIYEVQDGFEKAWPFEIKEWQFEYGTGYSACFTDGSAIHVAAWADCDSPEQYGFQ